MEKIEKKRLIDKFSPKTKSLKNCFFAFIFGGGICLLGEILFSVFSLFDLRDDVASSLVTLSLVFAAALLTSFGIFDKVARIAGAGTLLPVTGFSNAVVSSAMDSKSEGYILGVGSKIFTVSGPVILYGIFAGIIYGIIYYFSGLIWR